MRNINIAILGAAGVGKTTVIEKLEKTWEKELNKELIKLNFIVEERKHLYLNEQYKDKKTWTFLTQIDFLLFRSRNLFANNINENEDNIIQINIFERFFIDDYLYAIFNYKKGNINKSQMTSYEDLFNKINLWSREKGINFDLAIILDVEKDSLFKRIKKRDRLNEKHNLDWFSEIHDLYKDKITEVFLRDYFLDVNFIYNEENEVEEASIKIVEKIKDLLIKNEQRTIKEEVVGDFAE